MKSELVLYGDPIFIEELEAFLVGEGINAKKEIIIRASEPSSKTRRGATSNLIRIVESFERIAIAYLAFLDAKKVKCKIQIKGGDDSVEIVTGDAPEKLRSYFQKHKGGHFNIEITL